MAKSSLDKYNDGLNKHADICQRMSNKGCTDFSKAEIQRHGEAWGIIRAPKPKGKAITQEIITFNEFKKRAKGGNFQGLVRFVKGSDDCTLYAGGSVNGKQHGRDFYIEPVTKYFDTINSEKNEKAKRVELKSLGMAIGKTPKRGLIEDKDATGKADIAESKAIFEDDSLETEVADSLDNEEVETEISVEDKDEDF